MQCPKQGTMVFLVIKKHTVGSAFIRYTGGHFKIEEKLMSVTKKITFLQKFFLDCFFLDFPLLDENTLCIGSVNKLCRHQELTQWVGLITSLPC